MSSQLHIWSSQVDADKETQLHVQLLSAALRYGTGS